MASIASGHRASIVAAALAATFPTLPVLAQGTAPTGASLPTTTISGSAATTSSADVSGFGDVPLAELPLSATVIGKDRIAATAARRLADLTRFDASVSDAYNSPGYWDFLSIRGFVLDNRTGYRREGLPISAETTIPLDNKERVEILRGTSGLQAGTSAPGGLVNYVVKRPTERPLRDLSFGIGDGGSTLAAADLGGRFGAGGAFGYRLNLANERLRPLVRALDGERSLVALAADWRLGQGSVLQAEIETSRKSQPSQSGFSVLGDAVPPPPDPRLNLNNQPWSQPSVFAAVTGSLRFEQALGVDWRWSAQLGSQRLRNDDRLAYAFGCSAEGRYDRFCTDGSYDLYDYRSEDERRNLHAAQLQLKGRWVTGSVVHEVGTALLASRARQRFGAQAYNYVGTGNVQGTAVAAADPTPTLPNTDRDERNLEWSLHDAIRWNERWQTWIGLRFTRLARDSVRTDGSEATGYRQHLATPWLALVYRTPGGSMAYASYGEGVESQVVPSRPAQYTNAGAALPALVSRQVEAGLRGDSGALAWQLAAFQVVRPMSNIDACTRLGIVPCAGQADGDARHRGMEAAVQWLARAWRADAALTLLDAERRGSTAEPAFNGQRPTNVPRALARLGGAWKPAGLPGLELQTRVSHEGSRLVTPDGALSLPAWTRVDAGARYAVKLGATQTVWQLNVDNLFDRRHWKESPYQFGHIYLFPGAPRTVRLSVTASL